MSGGSWDYLYAALDSGNGVDAVKVRDAAKRMRELGDAEAATLAEQCAETLERAHAMFGAMREPLQTMEWIDSCDWGPERMEEMVSRRTGPLWSGA